MMYYLSIINDMNFGNFTIKAEDITKLLFEEQIWVYTDSAPFVKSNRLSNNDKFILYLAGKGRRHFIASFDLSSSPKIIDNAIPQKDVFKYFKYYTNIKDINLFNKKVSIKEIKEGLDFITDKKNYGLFLRQSVKSISKSDYEYILNHSF